MWILGFSIPIELTIGRFLVNKARVIFTARDANILDTVNRREIVVDTQRLKLMAVSRGSKHVALMTGGHPEKLLIAESRQFVSRVSVRLVGANCGHKRSLHRALAHRSANRCRNRDDGPRLLGKFTAQTRRCIYGRRTLPTVCIYKLAYARPRCPVIE